MSDYPVGKAQQMVLDALKLTAGGSGDANRIFENLWHSDTEDSGNFYEFLAMCPNKETGYGQYNSGNYCNPRVDELTMACQSETDSDKRSAMLMEIEQIIYDEAGFVPFHWQNHSYGVAANVKAGPIVNTLNFPYIGDLVIE